MPLPTYKCECRSLTKRNGQDIYKERVEYPAIFFQYQVFDIYDRHWKIVYFLNSFYWVDWVGLGFIELKTVKQNLDA